MFPGLSRAYSVLFVSVYMDQRILPYDVSCYESFSSVGFPDVTGVLLSLFLFCLEYSGQFVMTFRFVFPSHGMFWPLCEVSKDNGILSKSPRLRGSVRRSLIIDGFF